MALKAHNKFRIRLRRVGRITLSWTVALAIIGLFEAHAIYKVTGESIMLELVEHKALLGIIAGLMGGGVYIFLLRDTLRKFTYIRAAVIASIGVLTVLLFSRLAFGFIGASLLDSGFFAEWLFWSLLMAGTMFMVRINDQYGSGGLAHLFGRYHKPRQELRIFMFLDMRASTAIAEELGHDLFFKLLNDVYNDITDPVVYSGGELYQYIGDEISVSWRLHRGIKHYSCIRAFFEIQHKLAAHGARYQRQYGQVPMFKAGFHVGPVTTGEVGTVKKELIFSGDVVNSTARIQNRCNDLGVDILLSQELVDMLRLPKNLFTLRPMGQISLKGKAKEMSLWTVEESGEDK